MRQLVKIFQLRANVENYFDSSGKWYYSSGKEGTAKWWSEYSSTLALQAVRGKLKIGKVKITWDRICFSIAAKMKLQVLEFVVSILPFVDVFLPASLKIHFIDPLFNGIYCSRSVF